MHRLLLLLLLAALSVIGASPARKPHLIYILADDVGFADVCFGQPGCSIPTPHLDRLAARGTRLLQHYTHSTCTPSRASLMTGRYSANHGLTFAMLPGSINGLDPALPTLPQVLRKQGYHAHHVGKWHVGNAQWKQTPVGRGFESHVGNYLWSMEYETKELWELPWKHFAVDWVRAYENGTYSHYAEPRHSTDALTDEAVARLREHSHLDDPDAEPLFLYLAYTASHAPLEPLPADAKACAHLAHEWRRDFCGLMRGLDRGIGRVVKAAQRYLGDDVVVVFSSDNGGAPWFGGLNEPLRSGKTMPFEGGVRVPALIADLSPDHRHLGGVLPGTEWDGLVHISDWLPTFAALAGASEPEIAALGVDGNNLLDALREGGPSPRKEVLLEMYYASRGEFMFPEDVVAFRLGKYKLIESSGMRDPHWYTEPRGRDALNSTDPSWITTVGETVIRWLEHYTTPGRFDTVRDLLVHIGIHAAMREQAHGIESLMLFDLEADPEERHNIAAQHPDVVAQIRERITTLRDARPEQAKYWMTIDRDRYWRTTLKRGDCSEQPRIPDENCLFVHPFISDDTDLSTVPLVHGADSWPFIRDVLVKAIPLMVLTFTSTVFISYLLFFRKSK